VQERPSPCEFVLPEVGTAGLGATLHLEDPVLCGPSRILGRLGHYVSYSRFPFPYVFTDVAQELHILISEADVFISVCTIIFPTHSAIVTCYMMLT